MPHSESIGKLADALAKAQAIMKPALKEAENPFFKSRYADLASVWDAIREPLTKNGLSVVQVTTACANGSEIHLETKLLHASGEWISGELTMKPVKPDPQSIGSCLTYARRYALAAITGVASEEDDDGQAASVPTPQKASQAPPVAIRPPSQENGFIWRLGKHKGTPLVMIPDDYLDWASKNMTNTEHKAAAIMELDRRNGQEIFAPNQGEEDFIELPEDQ